VSFLARPAWNFSARAGSGVYQGAGSGWLTRIFASARRRDALAAVLSVVGGLALWEFCSRVLVSNKLFLAAPSQVVAAIVRLAGTGELGHHIAVSAGEFALGYAISVAIGIPLGLAMAGSRIAKSALNPWVYGLYATPTVALAPLFILWLGIGIWSKVLVVLCLVVFPVALNTEAGLRTTSPSLIETARSFGASRAQVFWKISLPSAAPFIFTGLKLGIGRGLIGVVVAELFGARAGLGQLISDSAETFNMPDLFAGVAILAVAGLGMTAAFSRLEKSLFPWGQD
jgi:NitT/TauT family transport system permease protein